MDACTVKMKTNLGHFFYNFNRLKTDCKWLV